jgi:hypothetical protein
MEVDMDEIVSAEELTKLSEDNQNTEITNQSWDADYTAETVEENEHSEDGLTATEALQEEETEYADVDVDPIKMEVDMDEIVSAEELTELTEKVQADEITEKHRDSIFYEELTAVTTATEEHLEGEFAELDHQDDSEENTEPDYSAESIKYSAFKEDLVTETEAEAEFSGISQEHGDSVHNVKKSEEYCPAEEIDDQTNDEQVIQDNYWENEETDSAEESAEAIEACEGEFPEKDDGTQINDFTAENTDSDYLDPEQQECKAVETAADNLIQETEIDYSIRQTEPVDCLVEAEEETITSKTDETLDDGLTMEDFSGVQDFALEDDAGEEEIVNSKAASTKGVNNVQIAETTEAINQTEKKSGKHSVFLSNTNQNSESPNFLKDVKIDLELEPENEESVINTDSSSRSSISELKKELMSLSELIKSTPAKVKSSAEVKIHD